MPPGGDPSQQPAGSSMDFLWGVVGVIVVCVIVWLTQKEFLIRLLIDVKLFELNTLQAIRHSDKFAIIKQQLLAYYPYPNKVDLPRATMWINEIGKGFNIPAGVFLVAAALFLYTTHPISKFCKTFDMNRLRNEEKKYWPQISTVCELDLVKENIHEGPWAKALSPMPFAKKFNLLKEERKEEETPLFPGDNVTVTVRKDAAKHVFTHQLGATWTSPENLPIHIQALFVIFLLRANRIRKPADKLLKQIARSASPKGNLNFQGVKIYLNKLKDSPISKSLQERHAYVLTLMASLLQEARNDGVLSASDFLWLKKIDRPLWYMLNNVGRRTAFSEIAGPWSHWQNECRMGRKLLTPMVDEAVIALEKAIADIEYVPDPKPQQQG